MLSNTYGRRYALITISCFLLALGKVSLIKKRPCPTCILSNPVYQNLPVVAFALHSVLHILHVVNKPKLLPFSGRKTCYQRQPELAADNGKPGMKEHSKTNKNRLP